LQRLCPGPEIAMTMRSAALVFLLLFLVGETDRPLRASLFQARTPTTTHRPDVLPLALRHRAQLFHHTIPAPFPSGMKAPRPEPPLASPAAGAAGHRPNRPDHLYTLMSLQR
jgi:hypothetical protein